MNIHITPTSSSSILPYASSNKAMPKASVIIPQEASRKMDSLKNIPIDLYRTMEYELAESPRITNPEMISDIEGMISNGKARPQQFIAKDQFTFTLFKMPDGVLYTRITDHTSGSIIYYPSLDTVSFERAMKPFSDSLV
ncbi:hypothetical protein SZ25_00356 [Candidatus Arcanobacter lacustris]|uniref:Uncharacterized protein n=1 Tax=Candidatus Arcanibacter lacustris TaxID=1607817 RepID=A0A0F5MPC4_9RICK|nr:hypothetical protein SZ25_00356 [Candidatus Arcanobacter lacustris]